MNSKTPMTARKAAASSAEAQTGPAFNTRARSVSRHSSRSDSSMPGTFEDSELSQNKQIKETTEGTWEKTPRAGREKEKEFFQKIDVSDHPYYKKDAAEHPSHVAAHNLKELQSILRDEKEGPRWYDFLARALEYDKTLFNNTSPCRATWRCLPRPKRSTEVTNNYMNVSSRKKTMPNERPFSRKKNYRIETSNWRQ